MIAKNEGRRVRQRYLVHLRKGGLICLWRMKSIEQLNSLLKDFWRINNLDSEKWTKKSLKELSSFAPYAGT